MSDGQHPNAGDNSFTSPRRSVRLARSAASPANDDAPPPAYQQLYGNNNDSSGDEDMEYVPPLGTLEDDDEDEIGIVFEDTIDSDEQDDEFLDAEEGSETLVDEEDEDEDEDDEDEDEEAETGGRVIELGRDQLLRLLNLVQQSEGDQGLTLLGDGDAGDDGENMANIHTELMGIIRSTRLRSVFVGRQPPDEDEGDLPGSYGGVSGRRRRARVTDPPKVPSEEGKVLMESGEFGLNDRQIGKFGRQKKLASTIMQRELGLGSPGRERSANRIASQNMIPSSNADTIIHYDTRCYSGQFSDDGNFFFSCAQDFHVRMYDTSNPYNWRYYKTVVYPYGQWTITDASLSPNNKFLAYSSIRSMVCLASTDPHDDSDPHLLDFANMGTGGRADRHFGVWSIRFSGDNSEIVAGTSDNSVYVYDIEAGRSILRIPGHSDDVNAVCFGDKSSPHILYSGSDDSTLKVWDRRSMSDRREAGVFLGHTEGLTYVDSKGDGRYVLSNGKDQNMKLWDLRKMWPTERVEGVDLDSYSSGFDYRFQNYDPRYRPHDYDCSVVTFRGHRVLKTLIRCHFSPPGSTDSRYVYSGSEDGSVYIWNLDATLAGHINVNKATEHTRPRGDEDLDMLDYNRNTNRWKTCVRDASWHPNAPVIAATSWNGYGMSHGTCTVHSWNDGMDDDEAEPKMGLRVDARLNHDRRYYGGEDYANFLSQNNASRRSQFARMRMRRQLTTDEDDD